MLATLIFEARLRGTLSDGLARLAHAHGIDAARAFVKGVMEGLRKVK